MSTAAKSVSSPAPMRGSSATYRNILDSPFTLKWPQVSPDSVFTLTRELQRCLTDMKRIKNTKRKSGGSNEATTAEPPGGRKETEEDGLEPPSKKPCLELEESVRTCSDPLSTSCGATVLSESPSFSSEKFSQAAVGLSKVMRELERGNLRAGLVCLSARPAFLIHPILMLAAMNGTPFAALPNLSDTIAPLLGFKSALAVGFKRLEDPSSTEDYFSGMVDTIRKVAPPIHIPWLTPEKLQTHMAPMELSKKDNDSKTQREVPSTRDSEPTEGSSTGTDRADKAGKEEVSTSTPRRNTSENVTGTNRADKAGEEELSTSTPRRNTTENVAVTPSRFSNRKQRSGKKKRRQRSSLASLATPEVEYFPVNIKKTVSRSKKKKK